MIICPICKNNEPKKVVSSEVSGINFTVMQCSNLNCQHGFISPIPSIETLSSHYSCDQTNDACLVGKEYISKSMDFYSNIFNQVIEPIFQMKGKLLDVGAGNGTFVAAAKKQGWDATGLEFNKTACQKAKEIFDIELFQGSFYELEKFFSPESFDLISFNHVFEHVIDPVSYVKYITRFLKPNGCIYLGVPNMGSDDYHKHGSKWVYLHIPAHISYFTCESLDDIFLHRVKLTKGHFEKVFQNTFPAPGMNQGEAITAIYRFRV